MKNCELCKLQARTYCESDQASLCWDCDAKVHAANFLVARHSRTLLCHVCNSLTPWKASGEKLGHTFSVCRSCVNRQADRQESHGANDDEDDDEDIVEEEVEEEEEEGEEVEVEEEEGENQVVPWSTGTTTPPPLASSSSSSSEESSDSVNVFSLKRVRENSSDLQLQEYSGGGGGELTVEAAAVDSLSNLVDRRIEPVRSNASSVFIAEPQKRSRNQREKGYFSDGKSTAFPSRPI